MGDGVHQIEEGRVLIQDVVERGAFQAQILRDQSTNHINVLYRLGVSKLFSARDQKESFSVCAWDSTTHRSLVLTIAIRSNFNVFLRR